MATRWVWRAQCPALLLTVTLRLGPAGSLTGKDGQPCPGTTWMPGPGRGDAGRGEQCPGCLPGLAGERDGAGAAVEGPQAARHRQGNLPPIFRPGRPRLVIYYCLPL